MEFQKDWREFKLKTIYKIVGYPVYLFDLFGKKIPTKIKNPWVLFPVIIIYSFVCIFSIPLLVGYFFNQDIFVLWCVIGWSMMVSYEKGYCETKI